MTPGHGDDDGEKYNNRVPVELCRLIRERVLDGESAEEVAEQFGLGDGTTLDHLKGIDGCNHNYESPPPLRYDVRTDAWLPVDEDPNHTTLDTWEGVESTTSDGVTIEMCAKIRRLLPERGSGKEVADELGLGTTTVSEHGGARCSHGLKHYPPAMFYKGSWDHVYPPAPLQDDGEYALEDGVSTDDFASIKQEAAVRAAWYAAERYESYQDLADALGISNDTVRRALTKFLPDLAEQIRQDSGPSRGGTDGEQDEQAEQAEHEDTNVPSKTARFAPSKAPLSSECAHEGDSDDGELRADGRADAPSENGSGGSSPGPLQAVFRNGEDVYHYLYDTDDVTVCSMTADPPENAPSVSDQLIPIDPSAVDFMSPCPVCALRAEGGVSVANALRSFAGEPPRESDQLAPDEQVALATRLLEADVDFEVGSS